MSLRAARITLAVYLGAIYATLGVVRHDYELPARSRALTRERRRRVRDRGRGRVVVDPARRAQSLVARWCLLMLLVALAYAAVIYPMKSPEEKIHFIEYGGVAVLGACGVAEKMEQMEAFHRLRAVRGGGRLDRRRDSGAAAVAGLRSARCGLQCDGGLDGTGCGRDILCA